MNQKTYRIWLILLDNAGEWLYLDRIAYDVNLTLKQTRNILYSLPSPPVERRTMDGRHGMQVRIDMPPEALKAIREKVTFQMYHIDDAMVQRVHDAVPIAGWASFQDLLENTGATNTQLSKVLAHLTDVERTCINETILYRRR